MRTGFILMLTILTVSVSAYTYIVKQDGTGDFTNVQDAIDYCNHYDRVTVYPGVYYENIHFDGKIVLLVSLYYETNDESYIGNTILDGNNSGAVLTFEDSENENCCVNGFTIRNGSGYSFPIFEREEATQGGGIYVYNSAPTLRNLIIENNTAHVGAGMFLQYAGCLLENLTIRNNFAFWDGGGVYLKTDYETPIDLDFNEDKKCNIYNNRAGISHDIGSNYYKTVPHFFMVDTITVIEDDYSFNAYPNVDLSYEHTILELIEQDVYVAPWGDDNNSGISSDQPFKTIQHALRVVRSDTLFQRKVFLAPGVYSPSNTGELYPINCKNGVSIIGSGMDETILDLENSRKAFWLAYEKGVEIRDLSIINGNEMNSGGLKSEYQSSFSLENIRFEGCHACRGAAVLTIASDVRLKNIFINECYGYDMILLRGNSSGFQMDLSNLAITNCQASNQYTMDSGGRAITIDTNPNSTLTNSLIAGNFVNEGFEPQSVICLNNVNDADISNITLVDNTVEFGGQIGFWGLTNADLVNSIMSNDCDYSFVYTAHVEPREIHMSHCVFGDFDEYIYVVGPGWMPDVIIDDTVVQHDPGFVNAGDIFTQYHLASDSYCIDNGTPDTTGLNLPEYDFLGDERLTGERIDLGCFEFQPVVADDNSITLQSELRCFPNPIYINKKLKRSENSKLTISYTTNLPANKSETWIEIYNVKGQLVKKVPSNPKVDPIKREDNQCYQKESWDLLDKTGKYVSQGVYFLLLRSKGETLASTKCLILK